MTTVEHREQRPFALAGVLPFLVGFLSEAVGSHPGLSLTLGIGEDMRHVELTRKSRRKGIGGLDWF